MVDVAVDAAADVGADVHRTGKALKRVIELIGVMDHFDTTHSQKAPQRFYSDQESLVKRIAQ